jgi:hypothetical protein
LGRHREILVPLFSSDLELQSRQFFGNCLALSLEEAPVVALALDGFLGVLLLQYFFEVIKVFEWSRNEGEARVHENL